MIAEVIIKRTRAPGRNWPLYCVWGRMMGNAPWDLLHVSSSDIAAKEAAHEALRRLQEMADDLMWSFKTLPGQKGIPDAAYQTIPPIDAVGRVTDERADEHAARRAEPESEAA